MNQSFDRVPLGAGGAEAHFPVGSGLTRSADSVAVQQQLREVPYALDRLSGQISRIQDRLDKLGARLDPVMRAPVPCGQPNTKPEAQRALSSRLALCIVDEVARLEMINENLAAMIDSLET